MPLFLACTTLHYTRIFAGIALTGRNRKCAFLWSGEAIIENKNDYFSVNTKL